MDIQQLLDDWLAQHPEYHVYLERLYYVVPGELAPADATHRFIIGSMHSIERDLVVALVVKPPYSVLFEALLSLIATAPPEAAS